ncbi:MAG TPA: hypothetical protein PLK06_01455 [bacterium]|nr:hypothetical protein [bacterium]
MKTLEELRGEIWKDGAPNVGKLCAFCDRLESEIERLKAKRKTDIEAAFVAGRSKKRWIDWLAEYEKEKK